MATMLQRAIELAVRAHSAQEDPPSEPYIVHPMRVLLAVSTGADSAQDEPLRCAAILHDTMERAGVTKAQLRKAGMTPAIIRAVELLTHGKDVTYADYVVRLAGNKLARAVKLADLQDNADLRHVAFRSGKAKKDQPRIVRYAASYKFLTSQVSETEYRQMMKSGEG